MDAEKFSVEKKKQKLSFSISRIIFLPNFKFIFIMAYLFTSESVSEGHPDKIADQISDALIDNFLAFDANSKVACETLVTTGQVILAGEVKSNTYLDVQQIARDVSKIGYTKSAYMFEADSCGILSAIHEQSAYKSG
jgi:S-adenosylmethionine synthetase